MSGKAPVAQRAGMHRIAAQAAKHGPQTLHVEAASRLARDLEVLYPPSVDDFLCGFPVKGFLDAAWTGVPVQIEPSVRFFRASVPSGTGPP